MEYRQLGNSGLKVSELTLGTMTFGGEGHMAKVGDVGRLRRPHDDRQGAGCRRQFLRYRQHVFGRCLGGDSRPGAGRQAQRRAHRHQGALPHGRRGQRSRPVAFSYPPAARSQPEAPEHRAHRPVSDASVGWHHPARGNTGNLRHARASRQDPLLRHLELLGLACHEGSGNLRARGLHQADQPADPLHRPGARSRVRTDAGRRGFGARHHDLEPAGRWPAVRQVSA